jgi:hypothetical protein
MYQKKVAYGSNGFPWNSNICRREVSYDHGICPEAEELHEKTYIGFAMCMHELDDNEVELMVEAFRKVWVNLESLRSHFAQ